MTGPDDSAGPASRSGSRGPGRKTETHQSLLRDIIEGGEAVPENIRGLAEAGELEEVWEGLSDLHRRLDERLAEGQIPAERARELRTALLDVSLHVARDAVEEEARSYERLLRDVSHDIRSPLHSIIFLAEALYSGRGESLSDSDRRQLGTIYAAATSLLNLVNDLLDYARFEHGETTDPEFTSFTLDSVVSEVRHLLGPLVEHYETDYRVDVPDDVRFRGDPQLLCRVLTNLVSNAVEAAGRKGSVRVEAGPEDEGLALEVVDDGGEGDVAAIECLIAQPAGETLADCVGERRKGRTHGLGLLICGRLVDAVGGRATAERVAGSQEAEEGGGGEGRRTRIRVWFPFELEGA